MAYLDRQPLSRRLANLGTAGLIELGIGAVLIAGLSVTVGPRTEAPQLTASNVIEPVPPPPEPQPQPSAKTIEDTFTAPEPKFPIPDSGPVVPPQPPVPRYDGGGLVAEPPTPPAPSPRFTPAAASPANSTARWVTPADYPARDLREGNQGTTTFRVTVKSDGSPGNCEPIGSSGFPSLDQAVCRNVMRRAKFKPATDENGAKVGGTYTSSVRWQIPR